MLRWVLVFLGIATAIGLIGISRGSNFNWFGHHSILYGMVLLPASVVLLLALRAYSAPGTQIEAKPFFLIVIAALLIAGTVGRNGEVSTGSTNAEGVGVSNAEGHAVIP